MTTVPFQSIITAEEELRDLFGESNHVVKHKAIDRLDHHCKDFIAKSPRYLCYRTHPVTGLFRNGRAIAALIRAKYPDQPEGRHRVCHTGFEGDPASQRQCRFGKG